MRSKIRIPASWNYSRSRRIYFQRPHVLHSLRPISMAVKTRETISFPRIFTRVSFDEIIRHARTNCARARERTCVRVSIYVQFRLLLLNNTVSVDDTYKRQEIIIFDSSLCQSRCHLSANSRVLGARVLSTEANFHELLFPSLSARRRGAIRVLGY